jgi:hypothetical protein
MIETSKELGNAGRTQRRCTIKRDEQEGKQSNGRKGNEGGGRGGGAMEGRKEEKKGKKRERRGKGRKHDYKNTRMQGHKVLEHKGTKEQEYKAWYKDTGMQHTKIQEYEDETYRQR